MEADEKKGVFGWYNPAPGLAVTVRAEWRPGKGDGARGVELELSHFDAEEQIETPITFASFRAAAEFLAAFWGRMNDGLNSLTTWGGLEAGGGVAARWASAGGEARLRFRPLRPSPEALGAPPAQIYEHEVEAILKTEPRAEVAAIVLRKILEERARVKGALRKAVAEVGGFPAWAERIKLLEAESLEWKRVANALYGAATMESPEVRAALEAGDRIGPPADAGPAPGGEGRAIWSPAPGGGEDDE
jgi:hypothetical protein